MNIRINKGDIMKITSAGIIKNEDKPRTGVVSINSLYPYLVDDCISSGINVSYESFLNDLYNQHGDNEDAIANDCDMYDSDYDRDGDTYLLGDWKQVNGKYEIDYNGPNGYAMTIDFSTNVACVEYSKYTTLCHHTSPCYVMSNGDGPCGDLDTPGDSVLAYTLPEDCFNKDND